MASKDKHRLICETAGLSAGEHDFSYEIDEAFFTLFPGSFIEKGDLQCDVHLIKKETLISAHFSVKGSVELTCDRSLDSFLHEVQTEFNVLYKYGTESDSLDDDLQIVSWNSQELDFSQDVYDYVALSIPIKRLHPRYREVETFEATFLTETKPDAAEDIAHAAEEQETIDPRWSKLLQIRQHKDELS
jgi:uncharacterized metal-binding protein YceD (DUF177 family)